MASFRNSIFGFNKDDVVNYIRTVKEEYDRSLQVKTDECNKLTDDIKKSQEEISRLSSLLKEYEDKEAEIAMLSKSIAKMHIIADSNTKIAVQKANNSVQLSSIQVENSINTALDAKQSLDTVKSEFEKAYNDFCAQYSSLESKLQTVIENIDSNKIESQKKLDAFVNAFNKVDNLK